MIGERSFEILIREMGKALISAADQIRENAPIPEAQASAEVVPIRQPQQTATSPASPASPATAPSPFAGAPAADWEGAQAQTASAPAATLQDVVNAFRQLQQTQGPGPIVDRGGILEQFGLPRVSEARPEQYPALIAAAQQRMGGQPGAA